MKLHPRKTPLWFLGAMFVVGVVVGGMGVYLNLIDTPILFAVCMALGVIVSALCIWISLRRKK